MDIVDKPDEVRARVHSWREEGHSVGFVPTMGALHEGHLSLIRASVAECDRSVVSVYVNPTQFGEGEDLEAYPRRLQDDARKVDEEGGNLVFAPSDAIMYPEGYSTYVIQKGLTERLCGAHRPGHFRGVLTIVMKLFHIVNPDVAFFGRKDYQQYVILQRMVRDMNMAVTVKAQPIVREDDGLAVSSRNEYLSKSERCQAACLHEALQTAREMFHNGKKNVENLRDAMREIVESNPDTHIEYVDIVSPDDLQSMKTADEGAVAVMAVYVGETRLIDNMPLG
ncbi:MAG: pantoate--beta-alanine ligase [Planctomycetota bacterium]